MFYQIMCVLHPEGFTLPKEQKVIHDLSDAICYVDFSGIFDRSGTKKYLDRQQKAESMFRPEGITLDLGSGEHRYLAFECSGSMSRQAKLSFIRADLYDEVRRRMMMDMSVGSCQLSKLYAYNGLMLSGGIRIDGIEITRPHRVIVVDNLTFPASAKVITVEGESGDGTTKKYRRMKTDIQRVLREGLFPLRFRKGIFAPVQKIPFFDESSNPLRLDLNAEINHKSFAAQIDCRDMPHFLTPGKLLVHRDFFSARPFCVQNPPWYMTFHSRGCSRAGSISL